MVPFCFTNPTTLGIFTALLVTVGAFVCSSYLVSSFVLVSGFFLLDLVQSRDQGNYATTPQNSIQSTLNPLKTLMSLL